MRQSTGVRRLVGMPRHDFVGLRCSDRFQRTSERLGHRQKPRYIIVWMVSAVGPCSAIGMRWEPYNEINYL